MSQSSNASTPPRVHSLQAFSEGVEYSLMDHLVADPESTDDGHDHRARQVFSGHYVPVAPTPLPDAHCVTHSQTFFKELGLDDALVEDEGFQRIFSGNLTLVPEPMRPVGWATGYALSIYGTEYVQQCPFGTGNGYGDGRAISVLEWVANDGQRWEMQLKGGGPTPYCRGADGRAVLRSSVREFLAQEYMHALRVPTSRSLTLFVSQSETVDRPWYSDAAQTFNPDILTRNPVAIATRVAPSFLRVGQLELFARRTRQQAHANATGELQAIVEHLIEREYRDEIDAALPFAEQVVELAQCFRERLTALVTDWLRVGYCQGNFNSDNCAAGGFTLDYGPFGFCELFNPEFQPWTGGGQHFSFFNQPSAAEANYHMFWTALRPLLDGDVEALKKLDDIRQGFAERMQTQMQRMWAAKLGLQNYHHELLVSLLALMEQSEADYTLLFRELSSIPADVATLQKCFYKTLSASQMEQWNTWLRDWRDQLGASEQFAAISQRMKRTNPKYAWREWLIVPAYQQAMQGDYALIEELKQVFNAPYDEQSKDIEGKYYRLRPSEYFNTGGVSHYSCSS